MQLQKPTGSTSLVQTLAWAKLQYFSLLSAFKKKRQSKDDEIKAEKAVAANDNTKFKKIKFIQIQIISKVNRYRSS
jgi:hypothetical protein